MLIYLNTYKLHFWIHKNAIEYSYVNLLTSKSPWRKRRRKRRNEHNFISITGVGMLTSMHVWTRGRSRKEFAKNFIFLIQWFHVWYWWYMFPWPPTQIQACCALCNNALWMKSHTHKNQAWKNSLPNYDCLILLFAFSSSGEWVILVIKTLTDLTMQ